MTNLKTAAELKAIAKERSLDKYGILILANIIIFVLQMAISSIVTISDSGSLVIFTINEIIILIVQILLGILVSGKAYLYMNLLNLPVSNLVPLGECLWIILGLILIPIILGIMTILNENGIGNTKTIFYFLCILSIAFFIVFAPASALITLILTMIVSIAVSYFGGENFSWYVAIK